MFLCMNLSSAFIEYHIFKYENETWIDTYWGLTEAESKTLINNKLSEHKLQIINNDTEQQIAINLYKICGSSPLVI